MLEWQIGKVKISSIVELRISGDNEFVLPDAKNERCKEIEWLRPHFMDADGFLIFVIQAFVVDTGDRRILVDTCVGNDKETGVPGWDHLQTKFLSDMEASGYPADSIDTVLCTHLHVDHVGWNTMLVGDVWVPTFKNARYLAARKEWEYWSEYKDDPNFDNVMAQSIRPIMDAGLMDTVEWEHRICPEVSLEPTPGHTPGHVSIAIESQGQRALITGDCIHHPCQLTRPEWCSGADSDQEIAHATRKALLDKYADTDVMLFGSHFPSPTAGVVRRMQEEGRYWLDCSSSSAVETDD